MRIGGGREGERRLKQQGEGEEVQTPRPRQGRGAEWREGRRRLRRWRREGE